MSRKTLGILVPQWLFVGATLVLLWSTIACGRWGKKNPESLFCTDNKIAANQFSFFQRLLRQDVSQHSGVFRWEYIIYVSYRSNCIPHQRSYLILCVINQFISNQNILLQLIRVSRFISHTINEISTFNQKLPGGSFVRWSGNSFHLV